MTKGTVEKRARRLKRGADDKEAETVPGKKTRASVRAKASTEKTKPEEKGNEIEVEAQEGDLAVESEEEEMGSGSEANKPKSNQRRFVATKREGDDPGKYPESRFVGPAIHEVEAKKRWTERYRKKASSRRSEEEEGLKACRHYSRAKVDGVLYRLNDCAYVKSEEEKASYICRIVEFFEATDSRLYFTAQWFYRAEDTVIKGVLAEDGCNHDPKRVFLSQVRDDNPLECLLSKISIVRATPNIDLAAKAKETPKCDFYYDMSYAIAYTCFANLPAENGGYGSPCSSVTSDSELLENAKKNSLSLLDLYSGCGAMSTGLCLGANFGGVKLETRWAVDLNSFACESLKLNHPQAEVRNEDAENFLALLREWESLCRRFSLIGTKSSFPSALDIDKSNGSDDDDESSVAPPPGEFEVGKFVGICYGDPAKIGVVGLKFKVRWRGYGPSEDTWEPIDGLRKCQGKIKDFVRNGYKRNILPLPGIVDVICGGPPCQGISGFNRFREFENPLKDVKNKQIVVFMDIVKFLKPRYVLMENVVDILKFKGGFLGRYAVSRLVTMNYQARMGLMVAGCYGLPQFRNRVFLWGALPTEELPQFPYPTHNVVLRGGLPNEFEENVVAYDEGEDRRDLEKELLLEDAISDLPSVANYETRDEMPYGQPPKTDFQRFIRLTKAEMRGSQSGSSLLPQKLFDHRPLKLNEDDYQRVCQIPKQKGANFRNLPGVKVGENNVVEWDPEIKRVYLPSGKPLVPDYAMSFIKGKSLKPFGRLWWDETVPTVVTRAEPHNQAILHPKQDRVLSIRENARLQGFPDYYRLQGPIKERYIQVGNAVAVPVSRALGAALAQAIQGTGEGVGSLFKLPPGFHRSVRPASEDERVDEAK